MTPNGARMGGEDSARAGESTGGPPMMAGTDAESYAMARICRLPLRVNWTRWRRTTAGRSMIDDGEVLDRFIEAHRRKTDSAGEGAGCHPGHRPQADRVAEEAGPDRALRWAS